MALIARNYASHEDGNETYILKTGAKGASALESQQQIFGQDSYEHLTKARLSVGQIVWDIGCGNGTMTEYLAKSVGEHGHVYALDISFDQINLTKERMEKASFKNVTFVQGDVTLLKDLPLEQADIVYSRFVLMHLIEPKKTIEKIKSLLKLYGKFVSQESIMSTSYSSVKNVEVEKYVKTSVALGKHKGVDFNIGLKTYQLCQESGFSEVQSYFKQHKLSSEQAKAVLLPRIDEWGDEAVKAKLTTKQELDHWRLALQKLPDDEQYYFAAAKQTYVIATK